MAQLFEELADVGANLVGIRVGEADVNPLYLQAVGDQLLGGPNEIPDGALLLNVLM